jgi:mxaJ protein
VTRIAALAGAAVLLATTSASLATRVTVRAAGAAPALRVCADPNNLPYSNKAGEGFENRLAEMVAADLGTTLSYTWWPQRRGFLRNTLDAGQCDIVMGMPARVDAVATTRPYYRSTYVVVAPRRRHLRIASLEDRRLRSLKVGVQLIGDDFANSPPAHALSARGIVANVVGYSVLGDYSQPNPPARIVEAVARGDIDVALVWGPVAGYFAARQLVPLDVTPISPRDDSSSLPFTFDISMAVRRTDAARRNALDAFIARRHRDIDRLLDSYGVPRVARGGL